MAQAEVTASRPSPPQQPPTPTTPQGFFRKLFSRQNGCIPAPVAAEKMPNAEQAASLNDPEKDGLIRRMSRKVVPGLPRAQTFKRQQSEQRINLAPVDPSPDERRALSVDHRSRESRTSFTSQRHTDPRISAPGILVSAPDEAPQDTPEAPTLSTSAAENTLEDAQPDQARCMSDKIGFADECAVQDNQSVADAHSVTNSQYEVMIHEELEKTWILNLSMHFRDRSRREKFFVTYREQEHLWRRVTISLDYRNAPPNSLEMDLIHTHYQREKSAKIYEAIRESLRDIQFYDTVTNLKLQTTDGRLHVHVVEDGNEIIQYPTVAQIKHLGCRRVREKEIVFDSHMSGFVYKVHVNGQTLIKKEIPSPDTVDEFLYEVNALNRLRYSHNVISFHGVVVDDHDEYVKGLLISYADQGALIDIIYENCKDSDYDIPWSTRERWARQIVEGLSDIHESGFVQGDFTLSNIVIDDNNDAKIIDINRRGCPVGWEPPEATPLIECNQRISMYIGVKSDLYQLGMVLWALAMQEDEPEAQGRPLILGPEVAIPDWYRRMAESCLNDDPRMRPQAQTLLQMFPSTSDHDSCSKLNPPPMSVDEDYTLNQYLVDGYQPEVQPQIRTVEPPSDWSYVARPQEQSPVSHEPYYYTRGRSPPSPLPSNYDGCDSPRRMHDVAAWAANRDIPSSYSDVGHDDLSPDETPMANNTARPESSAAVTLEALVDKKTENSMWREDNETPKENVAARADGSGEDQGGVAWMTELVEPGETKTAEQPEVEYLLEEPAANSTSVKPMEMAGEVINSASQNVATTTPSEDDKDYTSIKADSACDVVMPPVRALKAVAHITEDKLLSKAKPSQQTGNTIQGDSKVQDRLGRMESITKEQVPEMPPPAGLDNSGRRGLKLELEHRIETQGTTAPDLQQIATEASSRTVTPSKGFQGGEEKATQVRSSEQCQPTKTMKVARDNLPSQTETVIGKDHDSLTGIGAAHLINKDGDARRPKNNIDDDLRMVELESPHIAKSDMRSPTETI